jgi:hypothetical protein
MSTEVETRGRAAGVFREEYCSVLKAYQKSNLQAQGAGLSNMMCPLPFVAAQCRLSCFALGVQGPSDCRKPWARHEPALLRCLTDVIAINQLSLTVSPLT